MLIKKLFLYSWQTTWSIYSILSLTKELNILVTLEDDLNCDYIITSVNLMILNSLKYIKMKKQGKITDQLNKKTFADLGVYL